MVNEIIFSQTKLHSGNVLKFPCFRHYYYYYPSVIAANADTIILWVVLMREVSFWMFCRFSLVKHLRVKQKAGFYFWSKDFFAYSWNKINLKFQNSKFLRYGFNTLCLGIFVRSDIPYTFKKDLFSFSFQFLFICLLVYNCNRNSGS